MAETTDIFSDCRTIQETNIAYKQAYAKLAVEIDALREEHRQAMIRILAGNPVVAVKAESDNGPERLRPLLVKNWAIQQGIPMKQVTKAIENKYRKAHGLPLLHDSSTRWIEEANATSDEVRQWARANDIHLGERGRIPSTVIEQFVKAQS